MNRVLFGYSLTGIEKVLVSVHCGFEVDWVSFWYQWLTFPDSYPDQIWVQFPLIQDQHCNLQILELCLLFLERHLCFAQMKWYKLHLSRWTLEIDFFILCSIYGWCLGLPLTAVCLITILKVKNYSNQGCLNRVKYYLSVNNQYIKTIPIIFDFCFSV